MCTDDGREETVTDVVTLKKDCQRIEHLGLTLAEAKQLLTAIQQRLLAQQVDVFLASHGHCTTCGTMLKVSGSHSRTFRTLFSSFHQSPSLLLPLSASHDDHVPSSHVSAPRVGGPRAAIHRN
jgi:hypothetical protein